ncbi:MAG: 50S ribosomal protein L9 [Butyricicoccus sp.]|nr:50S ribosomal protein L9 [Butyricicoccus pullicaecorum]
MKVILKADVKGQGKKGEMIDVSEGYGRNFLLPRGLAVIANADNMNLKRQADEAAAHRAAVEKAAAEEYAAKLKTVRVKIPAKGGSGGRLFGAVTAKEVSECLKKQHDIDVPKNKIVMEQIKTFGTTIVKAKLYPEIVAEITVDVVEA